MIYLDNAASTKMDSEVLEAMLPFFTDQYGNASSSHENGRSSRRAVEAARDHAAGLIGARPEEIFFTSGGTEADNWAILGNAFEGRSHIVTTQIEHPAILNACKALEKKGVRVTYVSPDEGGVVSPQKVEEAISPETTLVSVMMANNEIGTIQPIRDIAAGIRKKEAFYHTRILFHTDAVQAVGQIPVNVKSLGVDLLSAAGHKFYGPQGIGFLYINKECSFPSFFYGGNQEQGKRAGTENVPGIVGLGEACRLAKERLTAISPDMDGKTEEICLRDYMAKRILEEIPFSRLNGAAGLRLPGHVHIVLPFADSETMLTMLDHKGICASGGSACKSGSKEPSHVLTAIGLGKTDAMSCLRFSLSKDTTKAEVDSAVEELKKIVSYQRSMSPQYAAFIKKEAAKQ